VAASSRGRYKHVFDVFMGDPKTDPEGFRKHVRYRLLKDLGRGEGMSRSQLEIEVADEWFPALFADYTVDEFRALLIRALNLMADDAYSQAIKNAYNIDQSLPGTLEGRRRLFMSTRHDGDKLSYRTLIRHERRGAALLNDMLYKIETEPAVGTFTPMSSEEFQERINYLEGELKAVREIVDRMSKATGWADD
jgi:hypothetical protein